MKSNHPEPAWVFDLSLEVDGVVVSGHAKVKHGRYMSVHIISPHAGLSRNFSIPAFGPPVFVGTRAEETATAALRELFLQLRHLHDNRDIVAEVLRRTRVEVSVVDSEHDGAPGRIALERKELRRKFRRSLMTQVEYQGELRELRRRNFYYREDRRAVIERGLAELPRVYAEAFETFERLVAGEQASVDLS